MDVMEKVKEAIDILDEVDDYSSSLQEKLDELNNKQLDLLHYIENNKINIFWCYKMIKEIKNIRVERRKVKQDIELLNRFDNVKNRMLSKDNRQFVMTELYKKEKQLDTTYKNRYYTEEELQNLLKGVKENNGEQENQINND